jgi:calcineurin-like phosphoesterase family protein
MSTTFFIADTHFGHRNIIRFEQTKPFRPFETIEEHDEELIRRWNEVVKPNDVVWHLGDVAFGKKALALCARLNGSKRLIMGNHDAYPTRRYLEYFSQVYGAFACDGYLLTHVPVHRQQLERVGWGNGNIHGHLHTKRVMVGRPIKFAMGIPDGPMGHGISTDMGLEVDPRYFCVSVEQLDLRPISFDELKKLMPKVIV